MKLRTKSICGILLILVLVALFLCLRPAGPDLSNVLHLMEEENGPYSGTAIDEAVALGAPAVPGLMKALENKKNSVSVRSGCARAVGGIGDKTALPSLVRIVRDASEEKTVRSSAVIALGKLGSEKELDALRVAVADKDENIRSLAAQAIGEIGSMKGLPLVESLCEGGKYKAHGYLVNDARAKIIVGNASDKSAALVDLIKLETPWVFEELGRIGNADALPALRAYLSKTSQWWHVEQAREAIFAIEDRVLSQDDLIKPDRICALVKELDDLGKRPRQVGKFPYLSLLHLGKAGVPQLAELLKKGIDPDISGDLERHREWKEDARRQEWLREDKRAFIRINLAWIMGKLGDQRAVPALIDCLDEEISCNTYSNYFRKGRPVHADGRESLRVTAGTSLAELKAVEALPALKAALKQETRDWEKDKLCTAIRILEQVSPAENGQTGNGQK